MSAEGQALPASIKASVRPKQLADYQTKIFPPTQRGGVWDAEAGPRGSKS